MPVQIKVKACGVCGTDLHIHEGEFIAKFPVIPGQSYPSLCVFLRDGVNECEQATRQSAKSPPSAPTSQTSKSETELSLITLSYAVCAFIAVAGRSCSVRSSRRMGLI